MLDIEREVKAAELPVEALDGGSGKGISVLFRDYLPELRVALCLMMFQQLTGNAIVMNYAPVIFKEAGLNDLAANNAIVVLGIVKVCSTVIAILMLEELGRRKLLLIGSVGVTCSMIILASAYLTQPPAATLVIDTTLLFVCARTKTIDFLVKTSRVMCVYECMCVCMYVVCCVCVRVCVLCAVWCGWVEVSPKAAFLYIPLYNCLSGIIGQYLYYLPRGGDRGRRIDTPQRERRRCCVLDDFDCSLY